MCPVNDLSPEFLWFLQTKLPAKLKQHVLCLIEENYNFEQIIQAAEIVKFFEKNNIQNLYQDFLKRIISSKIQILTRDQIQNFRCAPISMHAPLALEYRGNPNVLKKKLIGIVGSRYPTYYGRIQAARFAKELSSLGYGIISGGAIGIDAIANSSALLDQNGASIGVIGNGIELPYPRTNFKLFQNLSTFENGLLLSEFESFERPQKWYFPMRNATIAELCDFLLVIEATKTSGSLMTARFAQECGKPVGALPGSIDNPNTAGCHMLIQNAGHCIHTPEDIIKFL